MAEAQGGDRIALELAVRRFEPPDPAGPVIWLVGVTHIGEEGYYAQLQGFLDAQALVLYEGIGQPEFMERPEPGDADEDRARRTRSAVGFIASTAEWYRQRFGAWPVSLGVLRQAVKEHRPRYSRPLRLATEDAWGRAVLYDRSADTYTVTSLGADGRAGGTGPDADIVHSRRAGPNEPAGSPEPEGLQSTLAAALDLRFQLDALDYDRDHFVNSDMPLRMLRQRFAGRDPSTDPDDTPPPAGGGRGLDRQLERITSLLQGTGFLAGVLRVGLNVIALSPRLQATVKILLIEALARIGDDIEQLPQLSPDERRALGILIRDRNQVVVDDLARIVAGPNPPRSIAVLYGAAHLRDMEQRLRDQLGYRPHEQFWLPVFAVSPARAGLTEADLRSLRT